MYCKKCGNEVNDSAAFCKKCGYRFQTGDKPAEVQTRASAKASVSPSPVKVKPAAAEVVSAGVKPRARVNKYFVIGLAAILVVVAAVVVIIRLATANEGKKIANAVQNTFEAKSYRAEFEIYYAEDEYKKNYVLESYCNGDESRLYAEKKIDSDYYDYYNFDRSYLYMPDKMGSDVIIGRNEDGEYYKSSPSYEIKAVDAFSNHELYEYMKEQGTDKKIEEVLNCDYDELFPVLKQMMVDYYSNPKDFKYMKKCDKKDDTYRFVINLKEFFSCANDEYDVVVKKKAFGRYFEDWYDKDYNKVKPEVVIKVTLDGKYISKIEARVNAGDSLLGSYELNISDINKVDYETKKTKGFVEYYDEIQQIENKMGGTEKELDEENRMARAIYNSIDEHFNYNYFEYMSDFWTAQDNEEAVCSKIGSENNFKFTADKKYDIAKSNEITDKGAKYIAEEVADEDGIKSGEYIVLRVKNKNSSNDSLVVQYRSKERNMFGQYPEAVTADDFMDNSAVWGTYCPQN